MFFMLFFQAIQAVRTHELRAYIIYVKPPPLERLKETRQDSYITTNYYVNRPFKVSSVCNMIKHIKREANREYAPHQVKKKRINE